MNETIAVGCPGGLEQQVERWSQLADDFAGVGDQEALEERLVDEAAVACVGRDVGVMEVGV